MTSPEQPELPLPFPEFTGDMPLLPARMVNEYQYCPRLAYLEWVQGEWADSADTVEGRHKHKRVDVAAGELPEPGAEEAEERIHARSVTISSARLGLIARIDLVEGSGDAVTPVDYKRGKRPHVAKGAYRSYIPFMLSAAKSRGLIEAPPSRSRPSARWPLSAAKSRGLDVLRWAGKPTPHNTARSRARLQELRRRAQLIGKLS